MPGMMVVTALMMVEVEGPSETEPPQVSARLEEEERRGNAREKGRIGRAERRSVESCIVEGMNCKSHKYFQLNERGRRGRNH